MTATQQTVDDRPALRIERRLGHSVERVWRAVTAPDELARWFVAEVPWTPTAGRGVRGRRRARAHHRARAAALLAWTWGTERYRFELTADGDARVLVFTHVFNPELGPGWQHAAGWETYFNRLDAHVAGGYLSEEDAHEGIDALFERYRTAFAALEQAGERGARVAGDVEQRPGVDPHRERHRRADDRDDRDLELARVRAVARERAARPRRLLLVGLGRAARDRRAARPGSPAAPARARRRAPRATPPRPPAGSRRARSPSRARSRRRGTRSRCRPPRRSGRSSRRTPR